LDGKPLTDIKRTWFSVCKKAGLVEKVEKKTRDGKPVRGRNGKPIMIEEPNVRLHDLRHSFASILVSGGASLPLIGQMLGHTQVQTTQRYAHLFDDPMRKAAEMVGAFMLPEPQMKDVTPREAAE
jgi:integrase